MLTQPLPSQFLTQLRELEASYVSEVIPFASQVSPEEQSAGVLRVSQFWTPSRKMGRFSTSVVPTGTYSNPSWHGPANEASASRHLAWIKVPGSLLSLASDLRSTRATSMWATRGIGSPHSGIATSIRYTTVCLTS